MKKAKIRKAKPAKRKAAKRQTVGRDPGLDGLAERVSALEAKFNQHFPADGAAPEPQTGEQQETTDDH